GTLDDINAVIRWVVDPIGGTVNFSYGIPKYCVSVALQQRSGETVFRSSPRPSSSSWILGSSGEHRFENEDEGRGRETPSHPDLVYQTIIGVVYDPFCNELWTAISGEHARLNGRIIHVSRRPRLDEAIVSLGFAK